MANYKITKIKSEKRRFLKAINHDLSPNVNEIEILLEKNFKLLWLFPIKKEKSFKFTLHTDYDIHDYIKVGGEFNYKDYETYQN